MTAGSVQETPFNPGDPKPFSMTTRTPRRFELSQIIVSLLAIAVLLLGLVTVVQSDYAYQVERAERAQVRARILAESVTAAVDFGDPGAIKDSARAFQADPNARVAAVYDATGRLLGGFARSGEILPKNLPVTEEADASIQTYAPINGDGSRIGTVYLSSDAIPFFRRFTRFALIGAFAVAASLIVLILAMVQRSLRHANSDLAKANAELRAEVDNREVAEAKLRQAQKMESIGQLTGGIAHDFNNMLAIVIGGLDMIERRIGDNDRVLWAASQAREGANRAADLTRRLLAFARQQPLQPQIIEANQLVSKMSELLRRTLGEGILIETVLSGGLWRTSADPGQLENAVLNLCVNARDAMGGYGRLTIETQNGHLDDAYASRHDDVTAGQYVVVAITDTGPGMSREIIERAFEPFFTTKDVGKGTGLGLAQVHGFVRQTGGHVAIYSEIGQGTTIKIYLPRYHGTETTASVDPIINSVPRGSADEIILLVEDEFQVRQMSAENLRELGYTVLQAANGNEALVILAQHRDISLLFTDIVMPEMNGRQLADKMREIVPDLPVLYTTGYTRNAIIHNGIVDHGIAFLSKPFTIEQLARKLREGLDGRKPDR
ncbi:ATP-binding protein [Sphingorhabdus sp.]|uniref:ATP-binding protein n=1 Tax=Sphingorhabdus sp. TaxID=1902408 RepID=UPI0039198C7B